MSSCRPQYHQNAIRVCRMLVNNVNYDSHKQKGLWAFTVLSIKTIVLTTIFELHIETILRKGRDADVRIKKHFNYRHFTEISINSIKRTHRQKPVKNKTKQYEARKNGA